MSESLPIFDPRTLMPGGTPVELGGRNPKLPVFFQFDAHPLVTQHAASNIYVYWADTSETGNLTAYTFLEGMEFPEGTEEMVDKAGHLKLRPGDKLFARDMFGSHREADDVEQLWILHPDGISENQSVAFTRARDRFLGPRELRTSDKAKQVGDEWVGGVAWERSPSAKNISTSERASTLAQSYQRPRHLTGPAAGTKLLHDSQLDGPTEREKIVDEPTDHGRMRLEGIQAAASISMTALRAGPPQLVSALERQAEVLNLPRVGTDDNFAFPTMQVNISATKRADANARDSFKSDLGQFAGKHIDHHDSYGGVTCMTTLSDLDDTDEAGFFIVGDLGIAIELRGLVSVCFCGLRFHGGFPPTATAGLDPKPWSYRFTIVCYPPASLLDGESCLSYAALPKNKLFTLSPEAIHPDYDSTPVHTNSTTWLHEGAYLTSHKAFLRFFYRTTVQNLAMFARQIPDSVGVRIDFDAMAACFTAEPDRPNEDRLVAQPWALRPGTDARTQVTEMWNEHKANQIKYIPFATKQEVDRSRSSTVKRKRDAGSSDQGSSKKRAKRTSRSTRVSKRNGGSNSDTTIDSNNNNNNNNDAGNDVRDVRGRGVSLQAAGGRRGAAQLEGRKAIFSHVEVPVRLGAGCQRAVTSRERDPNVADAGRVGSGMWRSLTIDSQELSSCARQAELISRPNNINTLCTLDQISADDDTRKDGEDEDSSSEAIDDEDPPETAVQASQIIQNTPLLQAFGLTNLRRQLLFLKSLATTGSKQSVTLASPPDKGVEEFLDLFTANSCTSTQFAVTLTHMWASLNARSKAADLLSLQMAMERRRLMLCNAAAWLWLTRDCVNRAQTLVQQHLSNPNMFGDATDWFDRLIRDIYSLVSSGNPGILYAETYLPQLSGQDKKSTVVPRAHSRLQRNVGDLVCAEMIKALRDWLSFPSNKFRLSAYFVVYIVQTFKNHDVLLFNEVWRAYSNVIAVVLRRRGQRNTTLSVDMLDPFLAAIQNLPLADPSSEEASLLQNVSENLTRCAPNLHGLTRWVLDSLCIPIHPSTQPGTKSSAPLGLSPDGVSNPASSSRGELAGGQSRVCGVNLPPEGHARGLQSLLKFIRVLLPLVTTGLPPQPSEMQKVVWSNMDYYLPFRECAPSRMRVTGTGGPFHSSLVDQPGAFASWVIFRALLFNSPVLRDHTTGFFPSNEEFLDLLKSQDADGSVEAADKVINISCYGSPQHKRREGLYQTEVYFRREELWHEFAECYNSEPIPFRQFYEWSQRRVDVLSDDGGRRKREPLLPLVGKLTGFLLTADLTYAGKVECPGTAEMGGLVFDLALGALQGLQVANQVGVTNITRANVVEAFVRVYDFLNAELTQDERRAIKFDPMMLEHTLCKFQRLNRELTRRGHLLQEQL